MGDEEQAVEVEALDYMLKFVELVEKVHLSAMTEERRASHVEAFSVLRVVLKNAKKKVTPKQRAEAAIAIAEANGVMVLAVPVQHIREECDTILGVAEMKKVTDDQLVELAKEYFKPYSFLTDDLIDHVVGGIAVEQPV